MIDRFFRSNAASLAIIAPKYYGESHYLPLITQNPSLPTSRKSIFPAIHTAVTAPLNTLKEK